MSGEIDRYSDDAAQTDPTKDGLAVSPFAKRLAEHLRDTEAPNGYVIGLSGEWGSGKTSVLNYTRKYLEEIAPQREGETASIVVMDFKPWLVSGHQELVGAFFKVLSEELGRNPPRWKAAVADAAEIGKHLAGAISTIGWITSHVGGVVAAAGATAARASLTKLAERWSKQPSLQSVHDELRDILKYSATKYVVVIDDIDRLQPGEIQDIMMMVKTVGQLPNVMYLLSYDRNVVWPALQRGTSAAARVNFAEKLVQQEIALPSPGFDRLVAMLLDQAAFLGIDRQSERWGELAEVALRRWLRTPRDVVRLANNMRFAWRILQDYMEPVEYLAIEGVRTFDKALFDWLRDNPFYLFGSKRHSYDPDEEYRPAQELKASLTLAERTHVVEMCLYFFPGLQSRFTYADAVEAKSGTKNSIRSLSRVNTLDQRGIADARIYDAYFGSYTPGDVVGRASLAHFFATTGDEENTYTALKNAMTGPQTEDEWHSTWPLFAAISARMDVSAEESSVPFLRAALRVYSELASGEPNKEAARRANCGWVLVQDVAKHLSEDQTSGVLLAPDDRISLYVMSLIAENVRRHQVNFRVNRDQFLVSVRDRIQQAADENRLHYLPSLHAALTVWMGEGDDVTVPREWLSQHINDPWLLPKLSIFFTQYAPRKDSDFDSLHLGSVIPRFFDIDQLKAAIELFLCQGHEDPWGIYAKTNVAIDEFRAQKIIDGISRLTLTG